MCLNSMRSLASTLAKMALGTLFCAVSGSTTTSVWLLPTPSTKCRVRLRWNSTGSRFLGVLWFCLVTYIVRSLVTSSPLLIITKFQESQHMLFLSMWLPSSTPSSSSSSSTRSSTSSSSPPSASLSCSYHGLLDWSGGIRQF